MAKTLTRQVRLLDSANTVFVGDGLPLHATIARSLPTDINNLATYCDRMFQFAMTTAEGTGGFGRRWTKLSAEASSGLLFMDQLPIALNPDATHLCWTLGVRRLATNEVEGTITVDVTQVRMYLCPEPLRDLDLTANNDDYRFDEAKLRYFAKREVTVAFTANDLGTSYGLVNDSVPGWEGFMDDVKVSGDSVQPPIVTAVFVVQVANAANGERVDLRELSLWFGNG
jgi:hypothetical protein